jgi:hypothetical protein
LSIATFAAVKESPPTGIAATGSILKATSVGSLIHVSLNQGSGFQEIASLRDPTYSTGAPGVGLFYQTGNKTQSDAGFTAITADDLLTLKDQLILERPVLAAHRPDPPATVGATITALTGDVGSLASASTTATALA